MTSAKDEYAIKAISLASDYVKALSDSKWKGGDAIIDICAETRETLDASGLSQDVKNALWGLVYATAKLGRKAFANDITEKAALLARALRVCATAFVVALCLVVLAFAFWRPSCLLGALIVSIVERVLLKDAVVFKTLARVFSKARRLIK